MKQVNKPYVHIGGSISGRTEVQVDEMKKRLGELHLILDKYGCIYGGKNLLDRRLHKDNKDVIHDIPEKHFIPIKDSVVNHIQSMRIDNAPYSLSDALASYYRMMAVFKKASASIFDVTLPSVGVGFEIATTLSLNKPCLLLYPEGMPISLLFAGYPSRLLMIRRWDDTLDYTVKSFVQKFQTGLEKSVRFKVDQTMADKMDKAAKLRGYNNKSEYIRALLADDYEDLNI